MTDTEIEYGRRVGSELKRMSASFRPPGELLPRVVERERQHDRRRTSLRIGALGMAAVLTLGGLAWMRTARSEESTHAFQPSGDEFPITDLGPATPHGHHDVNDITLTELSRDVGVASKWQLTLRVLLDYQGGESPVEVQCIEEARSALCVPDYYEAGISVFRSATTEGDTGPRMWAWVVPAGTAFVSYVDGQTSLWQRPINGVAVFPDINDLPDIDSEVAVAYSSDGIELGRVDRDRVETVANEQASQGINLAQIDPSQQQQLEDQTQASLRACLTEAGATFDGSAGTLPPDADARATWSQCVDRTKASVAARLDELGATYRNSNA